MDRKSRSSRSRPKSREKKYKVPSGCNKNPANPPDIDKVPTPTYRDFAKYIPQDEKHGEEDSTIPGQAEEVFFGWLAKKRNEAYWFVKFLSKTKYYKPVFQKMEEDQRSCLQYPPNLTKIFRFGQLDSGYIVRYKNPWDFHVVLEHQPLFWDEKGRSENLATWTKYFSEDKMRFNSGVDLFRGLTALLSKYMDFRLEDPKKWNLSTDGKEKKPCYKQGDLVICVVSRNDDYDKSQSITLGYRAVVVQMDLKVMTQRGNHIVEGICMRLYLLDTGENRLVEQDSNFVTPLPEVFCLFRPLAIHCALHGISPVGTEWSNMACFEMKRLVLGDGHLPSPLAIEFYTNTTDKEQDVSRGGKPGKTSLPWDPPTYFVELAAVAANENHGTSAKRDEDLAETQLVSLNIHVEEGKRVNVATKMIIQNLGLQWNMFPDRPEVYPHYFDLTVKSADEARAEFIFFQEDRRDPLYARRVDEKLERGALLNIYTEHYKKTPIQVGNVEEIRDQVNVAFSLNENLESQVMVVRKSVDDVMEEDENGLDAGNNVLSTLLIFDINRN